MADRDMLFQAFANLYDNAVKYTPSGGQILVRSFQSADGQWSVEIADNGPGIPKAEHEKVVQRFYRLDQSRNSPGSGLGLALVFAVLKLHQLELVLGDNNPGLKIRISKSPAKKKRLNAKEKKRQKEIDSLEQQSQLLGWHWI